MCVGVRVCVLHVFVCLCACVRACVRACVCVCVGCVCVFNNKDSNVQTHTHKCLRVTGLKKRFVEKKIFREDLK